MNQTRNAHARLAAVILLSLTLDAALFPQEAVKAKPAKSEEVVELSPFVVEASSNEKYLANSSLTGTRIKTNLEDVGASITAITKTFLEDTDSKNLSDLFAYTASTESAGESGNYSGSDGSSFITNPQQAQRVRGLDAASLARGLFRTELPWDSYNVSQVEIVRGASSILFGQGSPAGTVNVNLAQPFFKNGDELTFRFDNKGSVRGVLDTNQVLVKKKLAARLILLDDEQKFRQAPSFEKDRRLFAAVKWNISDNLTFRVNTEQGQIRASRPNLWAPGDGFSDYYKVLGPAVDNNPLLGQANGDPWASLPAADGRPATPLVQAVAVVNSLQWGEVFNSDGSIAGKTPQQYSFVSILNPASIKANNGVLAPGQYRFFFTIPRQSFAGGIPGFVLTSLKDTNIFDWQNNNLTGNYSHQNYDFDTYQGSMEFLSPHRSFGAEFTYDYQHQKYKHNTLLDNTIRVDVTQYRPDGTPNPNVLRPAIPILFSDDADKIDTSKYGTFQLTVFAKFDFVKNAGWDNFWGRLFGSHTLTGLLSRNTIESSSVDIGESWVGDNISRDAGDGLNPNTPFGHNQREVAGYIYLGDAMTSLSGYHMGRVNFTRGDIFQNGQQYQLNIWDKGLQNWQVRNYAVQYYPNQITFVKRKTDTQALVLQSNFWNNNIVSTVGYRKDDLTDTHRVYGNVPGTLAIDPDNYTATSLSGGGDYFSWGVVAKLPSWVKLPWMARLNGFYSESENFDPTATGRLDALGRPLGPPSGKTKDYGFMASALNDKISIKVNWFRTSAVLNSYTGGALLGNVLVNYDLRFRELFWIPALTNNFVSPTDKTLEKYGEPPQATLTALNATLRSDGTYTFSNVAATAITDTTDTAAKGTEIELVLNPTSNWRIMANVSHDQTIRTNSLKGLQDYIAERLPHWQAAFNYPANYNQLNAANTYRGADGYIDTSKYAPDGPGYSQSMGKQFQTTVLLPLNTILGQDGGVVPDQRQWRFNIVTNYAFSRATFLRGFEVGGAYRWSDANIIGYPLLTKADGSTYADIAHPYAGPTAGNLDAWVRYGRKLLSGKVRWTIQLNVRNLISNKDPIPVTVDAWGNDARYRLPDYLSWSVTNKLSF